MSDTTGHGDGAREPEAVLGDQRIDAQADIDCLKALAATLDGLIAKSGATDARLRLRMDYARTLSVLRDRLRRLPEPKPTGSLTDRVTARWLASKAALSAALPATPAIPPAPISHDTLAPEDAPAPAVLDF